MGALGPNPILVVTLTIRPGREAEFAAYERQAAAIMARQGGRIERAIRAGAQEIHIVSFPSEARFDAYRHDPDLPAIAALRESAISHTQIVRGFDVAPPE